ncbi:MAG: hypothetical protein ACOYPR_22435 [Saprospiraceae bacterium]
MLRFILICTTILLLGNACQKEQSPITPVTTHPIDTIPSPTDTLKDIIELGKCTCLKNDKFWSPKANTAYHPDRKDVFMIDAGLTDPNFRTFYFSVSDIPTKKGKYNIEYYKTWYEVDFIPQMAVFVSQDYDQLIGTYRIDTTRTDHFIEVVSFDSIAGTVQGRFQFFTFDKNVTSPSGWGLDPKINLTEGKFHLKLQ